MTCGLAALYGYMWPYAAICGYIWLYAAICGHVRPYAAICGRMRPYAARCGHMQPKCWPHCGHSDAALNVLQLPQEANSDHCHLHAANADEELSQQTSDTLQLNEPKDVIENISESPVDSPVGVGLQARRSLYHVMGYTACLCLWCTFFCVAIMLLFYLSAHTYL